MGIFSNSTPFDQVVEKATHETNTKEDWALILDICDKVGASTQNAKDCLRSIIKRLNHQDPHVAIQGITLLDACVSNCGLTFHLEIASREFETEYRKLLHKTQEKAIRDKLLSCLEKWALNEFKSDPQLNLIPSMYNKLKQAGAEFPSSENDSPTKSKKSGSSHSHGHKSKSHGHGSSNSSSSASAASQKEAEDLAKAIELSLKETQQSPKSLYPQAALNSSGGTNTTNNSGGFSAQPPAVHQEPRKVRALYDFEAAEDNELTFYAGEIVHVLDDTDANWWEGTNQRGTGLFPANFVTADLSAEPPNLESSSKKTVQFNDEVAVKTVETEPEQVEIDEAKIDKALHFLHEADPTGEVPDPPELGALEDQVQQMGPLIDQELEKVDRRHAQLTKLGTELVDALNLYHTLMRDPSLGPQPNNMPPYSNMNPSMPTYSSAPNAMPPPGAYPYYSPTHQPPPTSIPYGSMPPQQGPMHSYASPVPSQIGMPMQHPGGGIPPPNSMYGPPVSVQQENGPHMQGIPTSNPGLGGYQQ